MLYAHNKGHDNPGFHGIMEKWKLLYYIGAILYRDTGHNGSYYSLFVLSLPFHLPLLVSILLRCGALTCSGTFRRRHLLRGRHGVGQGLARRHHRFEQGARERLRLEVEGLCLGLEFFVLRV